MKIVVIILDGAGDRPQHAIGDRTPLEYAYIPNLVLLAQRGRTGLIEAVFDDLPVESIVAALGILGYDPYRHYPNGRASFEALASGIRIGSQDLAFRCNFITVDHGRISDFTAANIDDVKARSLVLSLTYDNPAIELFPSQSYRNILVYRNAGVPASEFTCFPPHQHRDSAVDDLWVRGSTPAAQRVADELNGFQRDSVEQLARLNEAFDTRATMLWLWSPSAAPAMPSFHSLFGLRGAVVGGLHFLRGIGLACQMLTPEVPGATGYLDSNLAGKAAAATALLEEVDVIVIHLNAADEEAHKRSLEGKIAALELFDEVVVGPVIRHLRARYPGGHRVAVLPDHYTCVEDGRHLVEPVPCLVYGTGVAPDASRTFGEREAAARGSFTLRASDLMPRLVGEQAWGGNDPR